LKGGKDYEMEENKTEIQEPSKEGEETIVEKTQKLDKMIYEKRSAELAEMESRIDKKMKDYRELVDDVEKQGITSAGQKTEKIDPVKQQFAAEVAKMTKMSGR